MRYAQEKGGQKLHLVFAAEGQLPALERVA